MQRKHRFSRQFRKYQTEKQQKKQEQSHKQQTTFEPKQLPLKTQYEPRNYSEQYLKQRKRYLHRLVNQANRKLVLELGSMQLSRIQDDWNKVEFNKIKQVVHFFSECASEDVMKGEMFYQMVN